MLIPPRPRSRPLLDLRGRRLVPVVLGQPHRPTEPFQAGPGGGQVTKRPSPASTDPSPPIPWDKVWQVEEGDRRRRQHRGQERRRRSNSYKVRACEIEPLRCPSFHKETFLSARDISCITSPLDLFSPPDRSVSANRTKSPPVVVPPPTAQPRKANFSPPPTTNGPEDKADNGKNNGNNNNKRQRPSKANNNDSGGSIGRQR